MGGVRLDDIPEWIPVCAGIWLLSSVWLGWKRGLVRQAVALVALLAAVAAGFFIGPLLEPAIPAIGFPRFLRPLVGGCLVGLLLWGTITMISAVIFRKTDDQGVGIIRMVYGLSGAILGLLSGLTVLGLCAWGAHLAGSLSDGLQKGTLVKQSRKEEALPAAADPTALAALKKAVEESPLGGWIAKIDPVSPTLYPRLGKIGQVLTSTTARERLLADPALETVSKNPRLLALKEDPKLQEALRTADLWAILRDPKVQAAAADTQLVTALRSIDLDKAMDRALNPPDRASAPTRRAKP